MAQVETIEKEPNPSVNFSPATMQDCQTNLVSESQVPAPAPGPTLTLTMGSPKDCAEAEVAYANQSGVNGVVLPDFLGVDIWNGKL